MKLLLDTHTLIWWFQGDAERMGRNARAEIERSAGQVLVSSVSAFEMTTKHRLGKLGEVDELLTDLSGYFATQGFGVLPVTLAHAEAAGRLDIPHRDPFDRLLIAQARIEDATLLSNEKRFDAWNVRRIW